MEKVQNHRTVWLGGILKQSRPCRGQRHLPLKQVLQALLTWPWHFQMWSSRSCSEKPVPRCSPFPARQFCSPAAPFSTSHCSSLLL